MSEFMRKALPWIVMIIATIVVVIQINKDDKRPNYGNIGMSFGITVGLLVSLGLKQGLDWMGPGMLVGLAIGTSIKR